MPETVILCGGAPRPKRPGKALPLSVAGPNPNVRLESEDVGRRMLASLPATLADLLDVATYVYAADQMVSRGGETASRLGSDWRRDLRFIIPVREPERWAAPEVCSSLERLLGFMSEDSFRFDFVEDAGPARNHGLFRLSAARSTRSCSSPAGSIHWPAPSIACSTAAPASCSSATSRQPRSASRQKELATELARRFPNRVVHIPVRVRMHGIEPIERTQRTRSFLFGALAAAVARIAGAGGFSLFENGVVSFNLPIACQVVGAAATRTTHPRFIRDLSAFLSALLGARWISTTPSLEDQERGGGRAPGRRIMPIWRAAR